MAVRVKLILRGSSPAAVHFCLTSGPCRSTLWTDAGAQTATLPTCGSQALAKVQSSAMPKAGWQCVPWADVRAWWLCVARAGN